MIKHVAIASISFGVLLAAQPASADCKSDLDALKARIALEKDPTVIAATSKHVKRAEVETKGSESECRNAVTRGWRAFHEAKQAAAQASAKQSADKRAR
jgi:hypothetical protein